MTTQDALERAIELGAEGLKCFPCNHNKSPSCPHGFRDATDDPDALWKLWLNYPGSLIGVPTGATNDIDALDVDAKSATARRWWEDHRGRLLPTRAHRTRGGGIHCLYRHRPDIRCTVSRIAKGLDTRSNGGYIIWWPAAGFKVLSCAPIAPWPPWFALPVRPAPIVAQAPRPPDQRQKHVSYGQAALEDACKRILDAPDGFQELTINREAFSLGSLIAIGELTQKEAETELHATASRVVSYDPSWPWAPGEVQRKMARALAAGIRHPRQRHHG